MDGELVTFDEALVAVHALSQKLMTQRAALVKADQYYTGTQPLNFLAPEVREQVGDRLVNLAINWPRVIVGSVARRSSVEGFRLGKGGEADDDLRMLWEMNDLSEWSQMAFTDSMVHGRSFLSVGPNPEDEEFPRIMVESAHQVAVFYSPGTRRVRMALKSWADGPNVYATLYTPDQTWRFVAEAATSFYGPQGAWVLRADPEMQPLGVVPIATLVNRPRVLALDGESELVDVMPLADAVNKLATDMMVSAEFHAGPRRYATGIEIPAGPNREKLQAEVTKYWDNATKGKTWLAGKDVTLGQFPEAQLENFIGGIKLLTSQIAAIGGLPPDDLGLNTANPASAEARRAAETTLVGRVQEKHQPWGGGCERAMQMGKASQLGIRFADLPREFRTMETIWRDPRTPNVAQEMDAAVKGVQVGIYDVVQGQESVGLSPVQREAIAKRQKESGALVAPPAPAA